MGLECCRRCDIEMEPDLRCYICRNFLRLPPTKTDLKAILEKYLKAEQGALVNWDKVCKMTVGKDPTTYDIAKDILAEEIEHEAWFLELLYGRPSGHMRRKYAGERPHMRKHSRALDMG